MAQKKFSVAAAAGTNDVQVVENKEAQAEPAPAKPTTKTATRAKNITSPKTPAAKSKTTTTRAKQTASAKTPPTKRKPPEKKADKATPPNSNPLAEMLDQASAEPQGTVQIAIRMPPTLKNRLKSAMARANGMTQERFVAAAITAALDQLEPILDAKDKEKQ